MVKPLAGEPVRTALTVFAVALGVAVVLAMDLAGEAATGSFHSSLETLSGEQNFEVMATGGIPDELVGKLVSRPYDWRITPRMEGFAVVANAKTNFPLVGLDLIAESNRLSRKDSAASAATAIENTFASADSSLQSLTARDSVWVGESLGKRSGETIQLIINDRIATYTVRGTYPDASGNESAIVMDIAAAQAALGRFGRVDRIYIRIPQLSGSANISLDEWQRRIQEVLPTSMQVRRAGASTDENRKMLAAFRWNLRLLSYIALVVGAFLGEAALIGLSGALLGIPLGRLMATGAVKLMSVTVNALYVTSRPGTIAFTTRSAALALVVGAGVTLFSAWSPAREAAGVAPVEAMARGRREFEIRVTKTSGLWSALILALAAAATSRLPPIGGKPLFGYIATLLTIGAGVFAIPAFVDAAMHAASKFLQKILGVGGLLV